jgi:hypothetical protein
MDIHTSSSSLAFDKLNEGVARHSSVYVGLGFCVLLALWHYFDVSGHDPREPPIVKPSIPLIGHFVGFYRHGVTYLDRMR